MKKTPFFLLLLIITLFPKKDLRAVQATPYPITITQPDGSTLTIRLRGDEFFNYKTTLDGYVLLPNKMGILTYAQLDSLGKFVSSSLKANDIENRTAIEEQFIRKLSKNPDLSNYARMGKQKRAPKSYNELLYQRGFPTTGSPHSLVILVNFSDVSFVTPNPKTAFTNLLNQKGYATNGGTGSANDYFTSSSMGVFSPQFDVVGPYTLPNPMAFYGANSGNIASDDINPQQMVIDACTLASAAGVDFSQYDTDKNGFVDNVFIYYAGYNEAEGGPSSSIWPHRWTLADYNTKFNNVIVYDYACTSELRGKSGSNMCGIGTFCHEFGHVLGLPDYYVTSGTDHHTLSVWNIMDYGPYLNAGRTPPSYSAWDRFYLNWMTPTELKSAGNYSLDTLSTRNKSFLISQYGNHNLNGSNPVPVEFFVLENRQQSGWDTFLPGHGMLVYHIYYDPTSWANNTVNNDPNAQGVDIVEADGVTFTETNGLDPTLSGDPFPGTANVTNFYPTLRDGTNIRRSITSIKEPNGYISFQFMGGSMKIVPPVAAAATNPTFTGFTANWNKVTGATGYYLTVYNILDNASSLKQSFDNGINAAQGWTITASAATNSTVYSGDSVPAIQFSNTGEYVQTEQYILPANQLSFYIHSLGGNNGGFLVQGQNSNSVWEKIDSIPVISTLFEKNKTYTLPESKGYNRFRFTYTKGTGSVTFDDVTVGFSKEINYSVSKQWTTATADTVINLAPNTQYFYKVTASDKNIFYENITDFSNVISVNTLPYPFKTQLLATVQKNGNITVYLPTLNTTLYVYDVLGKIIREIVPQSTVVNLIDLPSGQVYILKADNLVSKIIK